MTVSLIHTVARHARCAYYRACFLSRFLSAADWRNTPTQNRCMQVLEEWQSAGLLVVRIHRQTSDQELVATLWCALMWFAGAEVGHYTIQKPSWSPNLASTDSTLRSLFGGLVADSPKPTHLILDPCLPRDATRATCNLKTGSCSRLRCNWSC